MEQENNDKLYCPKCGSTQLVANKKGFGAGKALTGAILTGGVGLLAGFIGSGNIRVTCLKCGSVWEPGQLRTTPKTTPNPNESPAIIEWRRQKEAEKAQKDKKDTAIGCMMFVALIIVFIIIFAVS